MSVEIRSDLREGEISLYIDNNSFLYDVNGLVTAFYPGSRVKITEDPKDAQIILGVPKGADRITIKNSLKKELYE